MSEKEIIVIIPWSINYDSRAKRELIELGKKGKTTVYYIPMEFDVEPNKLKNVVYTELRHPINSLYSKIIKHSFFYKTYNYFIAEIKSKHNKIDLVYIHDLESGPTGLALKKYFKAKLIYDIHDLSVETVNQQFPINSDGKTPLKYRAIVRIMRALGRRFEKKLIANSDAVITVNKSCAKYLKEQYHKEIDYFYNYPILRTKPFESNLISAHVKVAEKKNYSLYIGSLGQGRHLKNIVRSAEFLSDENCLVIVGNGNLKSELISIAKNSNTLNNKIYFIDQIPYEQLFDFIEEGTLGLMLLDPINKSKEFAFANKITEYMLCGIPVLLSKHLEHEELLSKFDIGYLLETYTPENIAQKINEINENKSLNEKKSITARLAFEKEYNWSFQVSKLNNVLNRFL